MKKLLVTLVSATVALGMISTASAAVRGEKPESQKEEDGAGQLLTTAAVLCDPGLRRVEVRGPGNVGNLSPSDLKQIINIVYKSKENCIANYENGSSIFVRENQKEVQLVANPETKGFSDKYVDNVHLNLTGVIYESGRMLETADLYQKTPEVVAPVAGAPVELLVVREQLAPEVVEPVAIPTQPSHVLLN